MNSVDHWTFADRRRADSLLAPLRAAAARLAELFKRRSRDATDIRVPPVSTDWVRAHERRRRGDY
jgi:hypothetical protein